MVSRLDDYQKNLGSIAKCEVYYNSRLVFFYGTKDNNPYPPERLVIWDDLKERKLGMLNFKTKIIDFEVTKRILLIQIENFILIYEINSLRYVMKIPDTPNSKHLSSLSLLENQLSFAFVTTLCKVRNIVTLVKLKTDPKTKRISSKCKFGVVTQFENISQIKLPKDNDSIIICASHYENKIHIYDVFDNTLLYCIFLGNKEFNLNTITIDKKLKFLIIVENTENLIMYRLKQELGENNFECLCKDHPDEEIEKPKRKNSLMKFISNIFDDITESFTTFQFKTSSTSVNCEFSSTSKKIFYIIHLNGLVQKMKFDRKKGVIEVSKEYEIFEDDIEEF